jgi:hypothetical protein
MLWSEKLLRNIEDIGEPVHVVLSRSDKRRSRGVTTRGGIN